MAQPTDIADQPAAWCPEQSIGVTEVGDLSGLTGLAIVDDLPARPQISGAELLVIETFFQDILDAVLSGVLEGDRPFHATRECEDAPS
jgi:hypothetical protein